MITYTVHMHSRCTNQSASNAIGLEYVAHDQGACIKSGILMMIVVGGGTFLRNKDLDLHNPLAFPHITMHMEHLVCA